MFHIITNKNLENKSTILIVSNQRHNIFQDKTVGISKSGNFATMCSVRISLPNTSPVVESNIEIDAIGMPK